MFVYDFVQLDCPFETVRQHVERGGRWLEPLAADAYADAEELLVRIGPVNKPKVLTKEVRVSLGPVRTRADGIVLPFRVEATGFPGLFPILDAHLEIAPLGSSMTQLTLWGSCDPPLGALGRGIDRVLLHHLAEATVRALLTRVVDALRDASGRVTA